MVEMKVHANFVVVELTVYQYGLTWLIAYANMAFDMVDVSCQIGVVDLVIHINMKL